MADDGSQQRKPDLRTAVEDVKALATALLIEADSAFGRSLRSPAALFAIGVVGTIVLAVGAVLALLSTGGDKAVSDNAPLIAAVIALGGVVTTQLVGIALEEQRTQEARNLEARRAGEAALQNYFENVGELLTEKPLRGASPGDNLSTVVRAQTLSVLEELEPNRKRILLLFLYESGLIYKAKPVVSLAAANLSGADLSRADLRYANLTRANLSGTDLLHAALTGADLIGADLSGANLTEAALLEADLSEADLSEANLMEANLQYANLRRANLQYANLLGAKDADEQLADTLSLEGATMPDASVHP
jgi:hypothetical protein